MSEEEKKERAIDLLKCIEPFEFNKDTVTEGYIDEIINITIPTILNLIETQQKELNNNTERINELINEVTLKDSELNKKDKIIDLMAEEIIEYEKDLKYEYPYKTIEEVKEYFTKKERWEKG